MALPARPGYADFRSVRMGSRTSLAVVVARAVTICSSDCIMQHLIYPRRPRISMGNEATPSRKRMDALCNLVRGAALDRAQRRVETGPVLLPGRTQVPGGLGVMLVPLVEALDEPTGVVEMGATYVRRVPWPASGPVSWTRQMS